MIKELSKNFDDVIIGEEESTGVYGMGRRWFCDPIDGTRAFIWGTPTAMFSLGLVIDGIPVLGVVYDPFLDKLYEGRVDQGSFCNGMPLKVSNNKLDGGIVAVSSTVSRLLNRKSNYLNSLINQGVEFASFSGAVYKACLVARGKFIGFFGEGVVAHDMAAVQVVVEESGGKITDFNGNKLDYSKPFKGVIVSNGIVHDKLIKSINF